MKPKEYLESIKGRHFYYEDGDNYEISFEKPLTKEEIVQFSKKYKLSDDIIELLSFTSGFNFFSGFDELKLTGIEDFGWNNIFRNPIVLAGDGAGNFWLIDADSKESWNRVYFICHDPDAWIVFSNSFTDFLQQVIEGIGLGEGDRVYDECFKVFKSLNLTPFSEVLIKDDTVLLDFIKDLDEKFWIADLRENSVGIGFSLRKVAPNMKFGRVKRHETESLWAFEKLEKKPWWKF